MDKEYRVTWEIDVSAESPLDAVKQAHEMARDPDSIATVYGVREVGQEKMEIIDLGYAEENET